MHSGDRAITLIALGFFTLILAGIFIVNSFNYKTNIAAFQSGYCEVYKDHIGSTYEPCK